MMCTMISIYHSFCYTRWLKSQTFYCESNLSGDREGSSARHVSNLQVSISLDYTRRGHLRRKALPQTHRH